MKKNKRVRQEELKARIEQMPFTTDEELAKSFGVSIQTIRLDRMEMGIPELRERIKSVATQEWNETVKALPVEEIIGEVVDLELDDRAISILDIRPEHVFSRNHIARGHHLFAQANSLAVALINDELALTARSTIHFSRPVKLGERVVAKATAKGEDGKGRTIVNVHSFVGNEEVFAGTFEMYRSNQ
ncbi:transcription factor FapR [Halobacillus litoralis]|uniref:Transcription factor FapR n=1 Tax=Halobacillus litoralis TaxID=45668 RepID=A0A845DPL5_9BACI|nr:transcription factor FapR [Halobacillus litoralis]MCA1023031.1 transcription factor FapR [Halobacillus litoralis]MYL19158.1 transcription factor FapR [Halobacillus litoralis]MYL28304.1 transcription factor FapR [Halobacillus halophilus]MYL37764.1 transcription factor FapR [Halobacillus litoralis]